MKVTPAVAAVSIHWARPAERVTPLLVADIAHCVAREARVDLEGDLIDDVGLVVGLQVVALERLLPARDRGVVASERDRQHLKQLEEEVTRDVCRIHVPRHGPESSRVDVVHCNGLIKGSRRTG